MAMLSLHRLRRTRCGRALSAAALVAWLTAAMQPCLMAMDLVEEPVPISYEQGHGSGHAMHEAADAESCDSTLLSGCDLFPDVQIDTRAKAKQGGGEFEHPPAIAIIARLSPPEPAVPCLVRPAFDSSSAAAGPPLTIRYCSFLE